MWWRRNIPSHRSPTASSDIAHFGPSRTGNTERPYFSMAEFGVSTSDAYIICSIAADLHISEVVDAPNWLVSMHLPLGIWV